MLHPKLKLGVEQTSLKILMVTKRQLNTIWDCPGAKTSNEINLNQCSVFIQYTFWRGSMVLQKKQ